MAQIYFNNNSFQIEDEEIVALAKMVVVMTQFPEMLILVRFDVEGMDKNGYDLWLSKRKAANILQYMAYHGIHSSRIFFDGFGEEKQLDASCNQEGQSKMELNEKGKLEFVVKWK